MALLGCGCVDECCAVCQRAEAGRSAGHASRATTPLTGSRPISTSFVAPSTKRHVKQKMGYRCCGSGKWKACSGGSTVAASTLLIQANGSKPCLCITVCITNAGIRLMIDVQGTLRGVMPVMTWRRIPKKCGEMWRKAYRKH